MRKYSNDTELAVYDIIVKSPLNSTIKGKVYRNGIRPHDSQSEDIVVSYLTGIDGQFQESIVNVNVYVPDITYNGVSVKDITRLTTLERVFRNWFISLTPTDYLISLDNIPTVIQSEQINQHFMNIRLRVKYNTL